MSKHLHYSDYSHWIFALIYIIFRRFIWFMLYKLSIYKRNNRKYLNLIDCVLMVWEVKWLSCRVQNFAWQVVVAHFTCVTLLRPTKSQMQQKCNQFLVPESTISYKWCETQIYHKLRSYLFFYLERWILEQEKNAYTFFLTWQL